MATFTWTPSFGSPESSQPKVLETDFGDGYSQRVRMGLNSDPKTWDLRFDNRADAERDQIRNFLEARGGAEAFDWTTLYGQTGRKWICKEWNIDPTHANNNQIRAKFQQVFEFNTGPNEVITYVLDGGSAATPQSVGVIYNGGGA